MQVDVKTRLRNAAPDQRKKILLLCALGVTGAFFACIFLSGMICTIFDSNLSLIERFKVGMGVGFPLAIVIFGIILVTLLIFTHRSNMRNDVESVSDGIYYAKDKNSGASKYMSEAEIREAYTVGNIKDTVTTIYGRLDDKGNKNVVSWKKPKGPEGNRNTLVIAPMGSGKTFTFVLNELVQTVLRGDSFVCTDPKGETFGDLAIFCQEHGYEVHAINLVEPSYSEFWNCLQETIDPITGRLDSTRLNEFAQIYMENSGGYDPSDFWDLNTYNLLTTAIGYLAWKRESAIIDDYVELYKKVSGVTQDTFTQEAKKINRPFSYYRNAIKQQAAKHNYDLEKVDKLIAEIDAYASEYKYNIGEVHDLLLKFIDILNDKDEKDFFDNIPDWHPASVAYRTFTINKKEDVIQSAMQSTLLRFQIFTDPKIKAALSNNGIHLADINIKKSAYFIITSDKPGSNALKPILSLFFSFFFKDTMDNYDAWRQRSSETGDPNPCLGVTAMLEEFYSIGKINTFDTVMTTCRSRHIYVSIIIQHIKLLDELYGPNIKNTIISGCKTTYFLGANDLDTMEFISKLTGDTTILKESHKENSSPFSKVSTDVNLSSQSRKLLTAEEARLWHGKVLVICEGVQPMRLNMFPWTDHWVSITNSDPTFEHPKGYIHMIGFDVAPDSAMSYKKFIPTIEERIDALDKKEKEEKKDPSIVRRDILQLKSNSDEPLENTQELNIPAIIMSFDDDDDEENSSKTPSKKPSSTKQTGRQKLQRKNKKIVVPDKLPVSMR